MEKGFKVKKIKGTRRYVIGDIHGCFKTFQALIDKIELRKSDQLFLLGDYIDKGPRNKEVLDFIFALKDKGFQVYPLKGNHEHFLQRDYEYSKLPTNTHKLRDLLPSKDLLKQDGTLDQKYLDFVINLPYYYELDDFILAHAGLNFQEEIPLADTESMLYVRGFVYDGSKIKHKVLVHGHTPIGFTAIQENVEHAGRKEVINLDNGCVFKITKPGLENGQFGRLCCLELDAMQLIYQENID